MLDEQNLRKWKFFLFFGETGVCIYEASTLLLEPHLQSILLWLLCRKSLSNYSLGLALNCGLPELSHPSS
jgi:hypothetical protein